MDLLCYVPTAQPGADEKGYEKELRTSESVWASLNVVTTTEGAKMIGPLMEHLQPVLDEAAPNLTPTQRAQFRDFLFRNAKTFAKNKDDLGQCNLVQHQIDTGNAKLIKQNPRRIPLA